MKKFLNHSGLLALAGLLLSPVAEATSFSISSSSATKQTLATGETGTVASTGSLTVTGNNVAITVTGNSTITNNGTISQTSTLTGSNAGNSRAIRDNTGGLTLTVNNGSSTNSAALIQTADADVIQMKVAGSTVTLNNYGTLNSQNASGGGNQAVDWASLNTTTGSNTINNYATGVMQATEADAVRPGVNGVVNNDGLIKSTTSTGSSSDGIDAQSNSGVTVVNANAFAGETGTGTGTIEGARHGITGGNIDITVNAGAYAMSVTNNLGGTIQGDNGSGINIDGLNGNEVVTVVNHGTITGNGHDLGNGTSHDGDGIDVDGLVNITNTGIIRSINAYSAVAGAPAQSEGITVGGGTITNSGTIEGLVAAGNTNAVGRGISLLGNDVTTGPLIGTREAIYGDATVTNQAGGLIRGDSDSGIAVDGPASGHTVTINNNADATIQGGGTVNAAIRTGADNDTINNAGTINGSSGGKAIDMGAGNNTLTIQGGAASILGDVSGGVGGSNILNFNIGTGNTFSYNGSFSNFSDVELNSGKTALNGANTYTGTTNVNSGAILGGDGSIAGQVDVKAGGTLAAGNSVGTLSTGNLLLEAASIFSVELDPTNAHGHGIADLINVTGSASINLSDLVLLLLSAPTLGQTFDILSNDGSDAIIGNFAQGNSVYASFGGLTYRFGIDYASGTGNDIQLTELSTVPEPTTGILLGLGGLALLRKRRANSV